MLFVMNEVKWEKRQISHHLKKGLLLVPIWQGPRFRRRQTSLDSQKQPYQRFSKGGISNHSPSLEDVTAVWAQFSKNVIGGVSNELYERTGTLLYQLTQIVNQGSSRQISARTMRRELQRIGVHSRMLVRTPLISSHQAKIHL